MIRKNRFNGFASLLGIGFLAVFLVGTLMVGVPNASATTTTTTLNKQVNITAVTIVNSSSGELKLETIRVENMLFTCTNNLCEVWVPVEWECEECSACSDFNATAFELNFSTRLEELNSALQDDIEAWFTSHNSSNLQNDDKDWLEKMFADSASSAGCQVDEYLNESLMPSRRELEDKDTLIASLQNSLREKNNTINLQGEKISNFEGDEKESIFTVRLFAAMLIIAMVGTLLYVFVDMGDSVRERRVILKGREGWSSEEKEIKELEEENERKAAELRKRKVEERGAELERELAQHSPTPDVGVPIGTAPLGVDVISPTPVQTQNQVLKKMDFNDVDGTAIIANCILAMEGYAHTKGDIEQCLVDAGWEVDKEKVRRLATNARRMVESLKRGKFVDGEQGKKPWRWERGGER